LGCDANNNARTVIDKLTGLLGNLFNVPSPNNGKLQICLPDTSIFDHQNETTLFGCTQDDFTITCNNLVGWDGSLATGGNVLDAGRQAANGFTVKPSLKSATKNEIDVLSFGCDSSLGFFTTEKFGVAVKFSQVPTYAQFFVDQNIPIQQCRAIKRGGVMSDTDYRIRYENYQPDWPLYFFTTKARPNLSPSQSDFIAYLNGAHFTPRLDIPSTCSYETYRDSHTCGVEFAGINALLPSSDMRFQGTVVRCPSLDTLPSIDVKCEGTLCDIIKPTTCNTDADCVAVDPGAKCRNFAADILQSGSGDFVVNGQPVFDPIIGSLLYQNHTRNQTGFNFGPNLTPLNPSCVSNSLAIGDINTFLNFLSNSQSTNTDLKYCFLDIDTLKNNLDSWTKSLRIDEGPDLFKVNYLNNLNAQPSSASLPIFSVALLFVAILSLLFF